MIRTIEANPASLLKLPSLLILFCLITGDCSGFQETNQLSAQWQTKLSFEAVPAGSFQTLETKLGTWTSVNGQSKIDDKHSKTGKQCLQLTGDNLTTLILKLRPEIDTTGELSFWAERWTRRSPFKFSIEKESGNGWQEIYVGDTKVKVGRAFLSRLKVRLEDPNIKMLRFTAVSPPDTGILIDDLQIAPARPQRVLNVAAEPLTVPALVGVEYCPLLRLKVIADGSQMPVALSKLRASVLGESSDIDSIRLFYSTNSDQFKPSIALTEELPKLANELNVTTKQFLMDGENFIWIACKLRPDANIDHFVGATCQSVHFSNGQKFELNASSSQRLGVALRKAGDDDVHTYRIPGLVTTNEGTLIGVYDVRRQGGRDLPGDIDVGMSRSIDGGKSWEPMKIIMDMGNDPTWRYDGVGDPAVLVDQNTGTIWVAATWSHGNRSWIGSGPGIAPEETGQLMLVCSNDDGVTWSKTINITEQVKRPEWSFILQGPGKGITMSDGTIVFAAQYQDPPNATDRKLHRLPHSTIIYSKDHGQSWSVGTGAHDDTTEAQVVETSPGVLMLNCRYNRANTRVVRTSSDLGKTWQDHPSSKRSLIEPRACMASLINVDRETRRDLGGWLLFSNPNSTSARRNISIKASPDMGISWPKINRLLLDQLPSAGYSCLTMIDQETVGILFEGSQAHMTFQRIPLKSLTAGPSISSRESIREARKLSLASVFSDHMVLQADVEIPIWGHAKPNSLVTVTLGKQQARTRTDSDGTWAVRLPARKATKIPKQISVSDGNQELVVRDVLVGEVWLCAGQSNMEWPLGDSSEAKAELTTADRPYLRLLHLEPSARGNSGSYSSDQLARLEPNHFLKGSWKVASQQTAKQFSAVGWHFGKQIQQHLDTPVGLICPAVGGTPIEAWIQREALQQHPQAKALVDGNWLDNQRLSEFCRMRANQNLLDAIQNGETIKGDSLGPNHPFKPGFMWEAAVKQLVPFAIKGVIWYQGESNAESRARVLEYPSLSLLLIEEWRNAWNQGEFPFLYVQLPALNRPYWPLFRDGQRRLLDNVNNVAMAITIDTGHETDVHPRSKRAVGERLSKLAIGEYYSSRNNRSTAAQSPSSGPIPESMQRVPGAIKVAFQYVGAGLATSADQAVRHFELSGSDGIYYPANARISDTRTVMVSSPDVPVPVNTRYAWSPFPTPKPNLVNSEGLPASPFTTENLFPELTTVFSGN